MLIRHLLSNAPSHLLAIPGSNLARNTHILSSPPHPLHPVSLPRLSIQPHNPAFVARASADKRDKTIEEELEEVKAKILEEDEEEGNGGEVGDREVFPFSDGFRGDEGDSEGEGKGFSDSDVRSGRRDEKDYDRDPEIAEILGSCFDDPQKAQARVEERIRRKRNKIVQAKTGSATPMRVAFNKFDFSNSYIWFEFYNAPLPKDVSLICDAIRAWHIVGRLGGCNSMNMQLSQAPLDNKRPSYDASQGANVTPTTFYNIGDLEIQDNLARIWVDIGTSEPLLLDVLINALTCISSDHVGIKQVVFGGSEFENWKENFSSEDAGCSIHKI
ncbi:uncharacterized protein [Elaeis guineensis]|uniref:Uncharacterized protein LOC105037924 n=1 Tax=Elaeis guineensis var. tenera TaxID=51953 RepID=A0A6I9QMS9_ELAGV|nr:uncharacterized protein LOC105037924 [Elaeis guineensis]